MSLPAFTKTAAFATGTAGTVDNLNTGQGAAVALVEGTKSIEKLVRYVKPSTVTGTQNDYNLDGLAVAPAIGVALLNWAGASDVIFTGFSGGIDGRTFIVKNNSAGKTLRITTQAAGSTAANRCINPSAVGQDIGAGGSAYLWYDGTASRWNIELISPGAWLTPAFSAGNFTTNGAGGYTVPSVLTQAYCQMGRTLHYAVMTSIGTVTAAASTELRVALPASLLANRRQMTFSQVYDNAVYRAGLVEAQVGVGYLRVFADMTQTLNWTASVSTYFDFTTTIEVQ